ncbi:MAG: hypothetical protein RLZZ628_884 [Bacteroidota bacterium]|jgi:hypothetical protein
MSAEVFNSDMFKQYMLSLLQEDIAFRESVKVLLAQERHFSVMKKTKKLTPRQKIAFAKKHALRMETILALQELFKDAPPAEVMIQAIQK